MTAQQAAEPGQAASAAEPPAPSAGRHRAAIAGCAVLAAAPLVAAAWVARTDAPGLYFWSDEAYIEIAVRHAADLTQTLGPYSRFQFAHPGPLWFYLLAPFYVLGGGTAAALNAGQDLLNALTCVAIVWVAARRSVAQAFAAAVVVLALIATAPHGVFSYLWNPYALVLPALLFLVLIARGVADGPWWLAAATVPACFLAQTHVGTAPFVVVTFVLGLAAFVLRRQQMSAADRPPVGSYARPAAVGVLTTLILWIPPLVQQATSSRGNLGLILKFFLSPGTRSWEQLEAVNGMPGHPWGVAATLASRLLTTPFEANFSMPSPMVGQSSDAWLVLGLFALACAAASAVAVRQRDWFPAVLGGLTLAGAAVALWSGTTAAGPVFYYLECWVLAIPAALALTVAALVAPRCRAAVLAAQRRLPGRYVLAAGAAVGVALGCALAVVAARPVVTQTSTFTDQADLGVTSTVLDVSAAIGRPRTAHETIRVEMRDNAVWSLAGAVLDRLDALGWSVTIAQPWADTFSLRPAPHHYWLPTVWITMSNHAPAPAGCRRIKAVTGGGDVNSHTTLSLPFGDTAIVSVCPGRAGR
jgi:hypothetical protein